MNNKNKNKATSHMNKRDLPIEILLALHMEKHIKWGYARHQLNKKTKK